jgi:hypothetical protein
MKRSLVLGGGGVTGVAWELGILAGLAEQGVDLTGADTVIGTSAGSVVGTPGWDLDEAAAAMVAGGFRHLVICDGDEVVGVLSVRDIVKSWARTRAAANA